MTTAKKNSAEITAHHYGSEVFYLSETIYGAGAAVPTIQGTKDANAPPCAAEIASLSRTSTGIYVVTLYDAYWAVAYCHAEVDDTAAGNLDCRISNWTNLQTATPATFTLRVYSPGGTTPADIPNATPCRIHVIFKKSYTGAKA